MRFGQVELHNVQQLLTGDSHTVLSPEVLAEFTAGDILRLFPTGGADGGYWLSRLPDDLRCTLNPLAQRMALAAAGCEIRFNLEKDQAAVTLQSSLGSARAEVWYGPWFQGAYSVGGEPTRIPIVASADLDTLQAVARQESLPFDPALVRVVLPYDPPVRLVTIEGHVSPPQPGQQPARRLLMYGSSITHGSSAARPSGTYAMRTAQRLKAELINLGFGGGAHLEPQMADYIAARDDWDLATLELGINILSISVDEFARRVDYFVTTIAEAHRDKPVFCIDVYPCNQELHGGTQAAAFREVVRAQVARMRLPNLHYVAGPSVLDDLSGLSADLTHPSPAGMERMADNLARIINETLAQ